MSKWCLTVMVGALLALPSFAKHRNTGVEDGVPATTATAEKTFEASNAVNVAPAPDFFAMPAAPRATPFPAAAQAPAEEPGRVVPRYELAFMYEYINFRPGDPFRNFNNQGGTGSFTVNASRWIGLTAELGGTNFSRDLTPIGGANSQGGGLITFLFGPRLNLRKFDHFVPFGEALIGGAHAGSAMTGDRTQYTFALALGGGVDIVLWKNLAWRFAQIDYLMTNFAGPALHVNGQNNFRAATGLVLRFGIPNPPPPPNQPPVAACSANPTSVYAGSGDAVAVHVTASDPDNDNLTYSYTASGGAVVASRCTIPPTPSMVILVFIVAKSLT